MTVLYVVPEEVEDAEIKSLTSALTEALIAVTILPSVETPASNKTFTVLSSTQAYSFPPPTF